jgi:hypothetical protein
VLTTLGTIAVTIMLLAYWQEERSKWLVLAFAGASAGTAAYSGIVGAYPITGVEAIWSLVALQRFWRRRRAEAAEASSATEAPAPRRPPRAKEAHSVIKP